MIETNPLPPCSMGYCLGVGLSWIQGAVCPFRLSTWRSREMVPETLVLIDASFRILSLSKGMWKLDLPQVYQPIALMRQ
jgi:hypothetical protein